MITPSFLKGAFCFQCKWSSCDDLVVEEAGQGSDSQPAPWKDVLSNGEQQGKVDYVLSHHAFTKPDSGDEFRPVAGRGDRLAANDQIRAPGRRLLKCTPPPAKGRSIASH